MKAIKLHCSMVFLSCALSLSAAAADSASTPSTVSAGTLTPNGASTAISGTGPASVPAVRTSTDVGVTSAGGAANSSNVIDTLGTPAPTETSGVAGAAGIANGPASSSAPGITGNMGATGSAGAAGMAYPNATSSVGASSISGTVGNGSGASSISGVAGSLGASSITGTVSRPAAAGMTDDLFR